MSKTFTLEEVAKHNTDKDCWIIVENKVYDVTPFLEEHPGGKKIVIKSSGKDATKAFWQYHNETILKHTAQKYYIGDVAASASASSSEKVPETKEEKKEEVKQEKPAEEKPVEEKPAEEQKVTKKKKGKTAFAFGDQIPYCDPAWYQDWYSPYYNDTHRRFRDAVRAFVEKEIMPYVDEWDYNKRIPRIVHEKCYEAGWLPLCVASWAGHEEYFGTNVIGGLKVEELDTFHELILIDEICRCGAGGIVWGLFGGLGIGLPPVLHFGSEEMKQRVVPPCVQGKKTICLCITEPSGGSDVANLTTIATKTEDGKHYIVNGEKKWITQGEDADFFTVAVRTGDTGMMGISMLLIERTMPGVKTRPMRCSGMWGSGTAYVTFEDVMVPVENLIGEENQGFMCIMYNFTHERFGFVAQATRFARVCYEEAFKYAMKRKTFGKRLIDHQAIRTKLAHMARQIEATQAALETSAYQVTKMTHWEALNKLAGPIALLKAQSSQVFELCAREAAQIFGGLAYTMGGQGAKVERLYREVRAYAIPGGSEEIMLDLGIKMAVKSAKL